MQIPKGDNLGNTLPQVGRTRISGDDGGIGQAMRFMGQQLQGVALKLKAEKEQVNQIEMRNAVLNRQKQVDALKNDINDRVNNGELSPDKAVEEYNTQMAKMPRQEIEGLNNKQQETLNYYYNETDYRGQMQAFGIYQNGIKVKAQNAISEMVRSINEDPNANIDESLALFDSESAQASIRSGWGLQSGEITANLKREVLLSNLQNKSITAADSGNYQALNQLRKDVSSPDFYKGILQNDDRVKLAHNAKSAMKGLEAQWREAKNQLKADIAYSDQNILTASANGDLMDNPYSKKDYISIYGEKEGERRYSNVTMWQTEVAPKIVEYKNMSVKEIEEDVKSSAPSTDDPGMYTAQDRVYKFKLAAAQQVLNERANKPINAAFKSGLFKPFNSANPDEVTNELARRYAALPELRKIDVNPPLVSKEEADMLTQDVRGSQNVDTQIRLIKGLGEKLPPEAISNIAAQIAPNNGAVAFSAMLLANTDNNQPSRLERALNNQPLDSITIDKNEAAKTILDGDQLLNPTETMRKNGKPPVSIPSDDKLKAEFDNYVGNAFQHNPQAYQLTFNVYKSAYASLAYRSGDIEDIKKDTVSSEIAKKAALMATGGVAKNAAGNWFSNKQAVVMPYGMDESTFKDKYKVETIKSLKTAGLNYSGWDDLTPVNVGNNTYRLAYGKTGRWAINPKTNEFITVRVE